MVGGAEAASVTDQAVLIGDVWYVPLAEHVAITDQLHDEILTLKADGREDRIGALREALRLERDENRVLRRMGVGR